MFKLQFIVQKGRHFGRTPLTRALMSTSAKTNGDGGNGAKLDLEYIRRLKTLEQIGTDRFRSQALIPGSPLTKDVFGGVLFAQSVAAAEATVGDNFGTNAAQSFFIRKATVERPVEYAVTRLRDGRSYCTRQVQAVQDGKVVFCAQVSLCTPEPSSIEHQRPMPSVPAPEQLKPFFDLARTAIAEHETSGEPKKHSERAIKHLRNNLLHDQIALFEFRPVQPNIFLGLEPHSVCPVLYWLKCTVPFDEHTRNDRSINRFLLGYITDATLVSTANRPHFSNGHEASMLLSLDHTVHFHDENFHVDEWMLCENVSPVAKNGRAFSLGTIWTRDGRLVLSCNQESLNRSRNDKKSVL